MAAPPVVTTANEASRLSPPGDEALPDLRVVALGGGTGLPTVLRGLRAGLFDSHPRDPETDRTRLTAIATVADDGGSSGKLRATYQLPSPGDIRNCLLALAGGDTALADVFAFRFAGGSEVAGHSLGNLILTALTELEGDFSRAVGRVGRLLSVRGLVLPATAQNVTLHAELSDGTVIEGESRIATARSPIRRVRLNPAETVALPEAIDALERAHLIVLGPGSLYSSLVAALLPRGIADAITRSRARVVHVMNLMTEPGETDRHTAVDHLMAIRRHAPTMPIHDILVNTAPFTPEQIGRYGLQGAVPVAGDLALLRALGHAVHECDLLTAGDDVRHDPGKLARALLTLAYRCGSRAGA
ncbi:MAG TPA: uridine diphosphate-N-acetylglucosamine-binding protein YvcK [Methylomirabilota bacterium]|jgi:uncharacterized cofD-like protein